jgi:XTP/dITP diphosphohydrolase
MDKLIFATNNAHKLFEVRPLLNDHFELIGMAEAGFTDEIPENEVTLEGNARTKAQYIYQKLKLPVFADDTGLEIEALKGAPGVFSARYAGTDKDTEANMQKVLYQLKSIQNRNAQFRTVICLIINNTEYLFEGIVKGSILKNKQGLSGFGYDPIFMPNGYNLSFAEMPLGEKNKISHRALATQKLVNFLKTQSILS